MLVNLGEILDMAEKGGFAVPAFNVYNMETVMGITAAAEEAKAPVIIQSYSRLFTNEESICSDLLSLRPRRRKVRSDKSAALGRNGNND